MGWFKSFGKYVLLCLASLAGIAAFFGVLGGFAALVIAAAKIVGEIIAIIGAIIVVVVVVCAVFATSDWLSERYRK